MASFLALEFSPPLPPNKHLPLCREAREVNNICSFHLAGSYYVLFCAQKENEEEKKLYKTQLAKNPAI